MDAPNRDVRDDRDGKRKNYFSNYIYELPKIGRTGNARGILFGTDADIF